MTYGYDETDPFVDDTEAVSWISFYARDNVFQQKHVEIGGDEMSTSLALSSVDLVLNMPNITFL